MKCRNGNINYWNQDLPLVKSLPVTQPEPAFGKMRENVKTKQGTIKTNLFYQAVLVPSVFPEVQKSAEGEPAVITHFDHSKLNRNSRKEKFEKRVSCNIYYVRH